MARPAGQLGQILRRLARAPRFTIVAILTLSAGVGANAAVFGVLNGVLLKPLPYPHPEQLVGLWQTAPGVNITDLNMSPSNYFIYREQGRAFQDVALYRSGQASVTGTAEPEQVPSLDVTDGLLPLLGVTPAAGRLFTRDDDKARAPATVMLGYAYWTKKYGGDASVVGRTITIDGVSHQIIGVLPRTFRFLDEPDPAVVTPFQMDRANTRLGQFSYLGLARLKPGVTLTEANADVARMLPIVIRSFPAPEGFSIKLFEDAHIGPNLRPLKNDVTGDVGGTLGVLMACIGLVMLIACANVANLWLVRLEGRRRELSVRAALGASRARLSGELLLECLTLGGISGLVGLALAWAGLRGLVAMAPEGLPRLRDVGLDHTVLLFTVGITLLTSLMFGAIPILRYARPRANTGLRDSERSLSHSREQHRVRGALVVVQVALALVLLVCSGLMVRTFLALTQVDPGFADPATLQTFGLYIPDASIADADRVVSAEEAIRERLLAIPGVTSAAVSTGVPLDGNSSNDPVFAQDRTYREGELAKLRRFRFVLPGYFATMGTPLIAGRDFTNQDIQKHMPVAVISRAFAAEYWGTPDKALGQHIRVGSKDDWREVIGVVGDVYDDGVSQAATSNVYWPIIQDRFEGQPVDVRRFVTFSMRTPRAGTDALMRDAQQAVWSVNASLPLFSARTMGELYRRSMARTSFTLILLGVAGVMALFLGVVGLYGVIAYSVSQRTREIGIRMALGAQPELLTGMFVWDGLRLAAIGVVCGVTAAFFAVRLMSSLLFHVSAADPVTYAVVSVGLVVTSLLATYLPSRRAAGIDPAIALRGD